MRLAEGVSIFQLRGQHGDLGRDAGRILRQEVHEGPEDGDRGDEEQKQDEHVSIALLSLGVSAFTAGFTQ